MGAVSLRPLWALCLASTPYHIRNGGTSQQRLILLVLAKLQSATGYSGNGTHLTINHINLPGSFPWEPHCGFDCRWSLFRHTDSRALMITAAGFGLNLCSPYRRLVRQEAKASTHRLGTALPRPLLLPQRYFCHIMQNNNIHLIMK